MKQVGWWKHAIQIRMIKSSTIIKSLRRLRAKEEEELMRKISSVSGFNRFDCERCGANIPVERRLAIKGVRTCVGCSTERAKTEDDVEIDGSDSADIQRIVSLPRGEL